jgi:ATP-dependent protease Clp ATPase subunit
MPEQTVSEAVFEYEGITLRFTEGAFKAIAQKALARKSGARGLRSVMEECMLDVMYELPSDEHAGMRDQRAGHYPRGIPGHPVQ